MNFVITAVIWIVLPFMLIVMRVGTWSDPLDIYISSNPFVQGIAVVEGTVGLNVKQGFETLKFDWTMGRRNFEETLIAFSISFVGYLILGLILLWRTKKRIRRKIF